MNIYELTMYVNQDVDDSFTSEEVLRWFNKGISNFNLIPPLTKYPTLTTQDLDEGDADYALDDMFILGVMLPFISSSIRGQESSLSEKQLYLQEYMTNARLYKSALNIPADMMFVTESTDLAKYRVGENVYVSDMSFAPFRGDWTVQATTLPEYSEETE